MATTALDNFKAYLVQQAALLGNTFDQFRVLAYIDEWYSTWQAISALRGTTTTSYTMNGRSVSRQSLPSLQLQLDRLQRDIEDLLFMRSVALVDNRGFYTLAWPFVGGTVTP